MFPSPCGVKVVANPIEFDADDFHTCEMFPSPCGVKVVANGVSGRHRTAALKALVSVPLRGKGCG